MIDRAEGAIGIFDSGVGGLTVLRRIIELLPEASTVYLGDTARVPYGTKSRQTVVRYASNCSRALMNSGISVLVVACNTASAYALEDLRSDLDVPVIGVVEPGACAAVAATKNKRIGVIGTEGTIRSGAYQNAIQSIVPTASVVCRACPLFVPLAEEGWTTGRIPDGAAQEYLSGFREDDIDTLILGCTHYPLLHESIAKAIGKGIAIVDSAFATAAVVEETVAGLGLEVSNGRKPQRRFLVSDSPESFAEVGRTFLGQAIENIEWVDF